MSITLPSSSELDTTLQRAIRAKTKSGVRELAITTEAHRVVIHGHASSYYVVQLALSAAQEVLRNQGDARPVRTKIVVEPAKKRS